MFVFQSLYGSEPVTKVQLVSLSAFQLKISGFLSSISPGSMHANGVC